MKNVFSTSEPLIEPLGKTTVMASADAQYDEVTHELTVNLKLSSSSGLPKVVRTKTSRLDASDTARDIFHSWIRNLVKGGAISIEGA